MFQDHQQEMKRILRKARRYSVRNKTQKPAKFSPFDEKNKGHFLLSPDQF